MTVPVQHGFPDWARQIATTDVVILNITGNSLPAALTTLASTFVGNHEYIVVDMDTAGERQALRFNWFADSGFVTLVMSDRLIFRANANAHMTIPCKAPFLQIQGQGVAGAGVYDLYVIRSNVAGAGFTDFVDQPILVRSVGLAVGIGATVTVEAASTVPGRAMWSVDTALATWTARLESADLAGTYTAFASMRNTSLPGPRMVCLPPSSVRCSFTNTTGAAGAVDQFLVSDTFGIA